MRFLLATYCPIPCFLFCDHCLIIISAKYYASDSYSFAEYIGLMLNGRVGPKTWGEIVVTESRSFEAAPFFSVLSSKANDHLVSYHCFVSTEYCLECWDAPSYCLISRRSHHLFLVSDWFHARALPLLPFTFSIPPPTPSHSYMKKHKNNHGGLHIYGYCTDCGYRTVTMCLGRQRRSIYVEGISIHCMR